MIGKGGENALRLFRQTWNPNRIKRNTMVQIVIVTLAFLALVRVWPCGLVQRHTYSRQQAFSRSGKDVPAGDSFTSDDKKLQTVYFSEDHIYRISLYMDCVVSGEPTEAQIVLFRLYDSGFSCVFEEEIDSRRIEKKGVLTATLDMDVDIDIEYYYEILIPEESQARYRLPVAERSALGQTENGVLYIDGIYNDEESLIADFDYSRPLTIVGIVLCDILILGAALLVYCLVYGIVMLYDHQPAANRRSVRNGFRVGGSIAVVLAALFLIVYSVILNRFGGEVWDRLFFLAGIVTAMLWSLSALWVPVFFPPKKENPVKSARSRVSLIWRNYIQTVSFGLLFYALCQYVNADRNLYHYTNTRWMLIFLAIALLMNYNERQLVNVFGIAWLLLGIAGSVIYCGTVGTEENDLLLARLTCGAVVTWGLLVVNALVCLVQSADPRSFRVGDWFMMRLAEYRKQMVYLVLWVLFSLLMYANRYEKVWVFTATLPFLAYLFAPRTRGGEFRFLRNFGNGILTSFVLVTLFCLLHRPHQYWTYYRYGGIFHTVACTGMYLAVVFGVAVAKLYGKLRKRDHFLFCCHLEYFVTACVAGFILLTMSRTAFLTVTVMVLAVAGLAAAVHRKRIGRLFSELGVLLAVCLVSFPMIYTSVRMVPAVVNDPIHYDIEIQKKTETIYKGDPIDSDKYMTVRWFFTTLFGRFQTEEGSADAGKILPRESGELAYTGNDLAGIVMRRVSGDSDGDDGSGGKTGGDISNGRFDIFLDYIDAIGLDGHPKMGPLDKEGNEYTHAHNSYLQVAYNFGLIAGILFLILCAFTLWRSVQFALDYGKKRSIIFVPLAMVVVFGFISLTEWAYHPCIPAGFSFIMMQMVLMRTNTQGR